MPKSVNAEFVSDLGCMPALSVTHSAASAAVYGLWRFISALPFCLLVAGYNTAPWSFPGRVRDRAVGPSTTYRRCRRCTKLIALCSYSRTCHLMILSASQQLNQGWNAALWSSIDGGGRLCPSNQTIVTSFGGAGWTFGLDFLYVVSCEVEQRTESVPVWNELHVACHRHYCLAQRRTCTMHGTMTTDAV